MRIRPFERADTEPVVELWHSAGLTRPWNDPYRDIERKLAVQPELFLLADEDTHEGGRVIGTVMGGYDGHRGWIHFLAVSPDRQGAGIGRTLVTEVEARLRALGCPKVNLQVRGDNDPAIGFYRALGYAPDDVVSLGRRLITDD